MFCHINYHILTCKHINCNYVTDHKHDTSKLFKDLLNKSYEEYPKEIDQPQISTNLTIFDNDTEHTATFAKPIPTRLLDKLADDEEKEYCNNNLTLTSTKCYNNFFY